MKKLIFAFIAIAGSYAVRAQDITIINNTTRTHYVAIDALSGGSSHLSSNITINPLATIGPNDVDAYWFSIVGVSLPAPNSYVWHAHITGDCGGFDVEINNPQHIACPGAPNEFTVTFDFDPSTRDAVITFDY